MKTEYEPKQTYVWREGRAVPKSEAAPLNAPPRINVISDTIAPIKSMADGKMYDSKSRYYAEVKARGFEVVGNDIPMKPRNREPDARKIERVIDSVMRGE